MERPARVSARVNAHRALSSSSRVQILDLLQRSDVPLGVEDVADAVGLHPNTAREHLDRLIRAGFVTRTPERSGTRGRPRLRYTTADVAPGDGAAVNADTLARDLLARALLDGYRRTVSAPAATAAAAGQRVAEHDTQTGALPPTPPDDAPTSDGHDRLRQLAALEAHFEDLGFEPDADVDSWCVHLRRCPVRRLAQEHTEVVCSVHLGLARGVLGAAGGPLTATRLEPFVGPDHCVLHLGAAPAAP